MFSAMRFSAEAPPERPADPAVRRANLRRIGRLFSPYKLRLSGVLLLIGYALIRAGRVAEARGVLDSALARFPTIAALHKNAALAAYQMGENQRALTELDRAIQLDRSFAPARALRARARAAAGNRAGALEDWNAYLALAPDPQERAELEGELRERGVLKGP